MRNLVHAFVTTRETVSARADGSLPGRPMPPVITDLLTDSDRSSEETRSIVAVAAAGRPEPASRRDPRQNSSPAERVA